MHICTHYLTYEQTYSIIDYIQNSHLIMMLNYHLAEANQPANRYRITLELATHDDFNPHQISYSDIFNLQDDEHINYYIEPL